MHILMLKQIHMSPVILTLEHFISSIWTGRLSIRDDRCWTAWIKKILIMTFCGSSSLVKGVWSAPEEIYIMNHKHKLHVLLFVFNDSMI